MKQGTPVNFVVDPVKYEQSRTTWKKMLDALKPDDTPLSLPDIFKQVYDLKIERMFAPSKQPATIYFPSQEALDSFISWFQKQNIPKPTLAAWHDTPEFKSAVVEAGISDGEVKDFVDRLNGAVKAEIFGESHGNNLDLKSGD